MPPPPTAHLSPDAGHPAPLDHIGQALNAAARVWKSEFDQRMCERGHAIAKEAAIGALEHIGPDGITQSALARAMGVTKQASQQFVDRLVTLGLVVRQPDPSDHRANSVRLTPLGQQVMTAANEVKSTIEARYRRAMGNSAFAFLKATLNHLPKSRP